MKRNQTAQEIIKKARLLFSKEGYLGASMENLAQKLKVSKAALYYHFPSKKEIYKKVLEEILKDFKNQIKKASLSPPSKRFEKIIKVYLKFGREEKNLPRILLYPSKEKELKPLILKFKKEIEKTLSDALKENLPLSKIPLLIKLLDGFLLEATFSKPKKKIELFSRKILKFFGLKIS